MKKLSTIILLLHIGLIHSCSPRLFQKEGVEYHYTYFSQPNMKDHRIWFSDSSIISEQKMTIRESLNDMVIYEGFDVYKYTYFDITTMRCQDYHAFSDTAKPYCNYFLKLNELITWNFYNSESIERKSDGLLPLSDTIIRNQSYKRLKKVNKFNGYGDEYVMYLVCNTKDNIFHVDKKLEKKYPGCKIARLDLVDSNDVSTYSFEYKIVRSRLNKNEKNIFEKWKRNSSETLLPLITLSEVYKMKMDTIPHNLIPK